MWLVIAVDSRVCLFGNMTFAAPRAIRTPPKPPTPIFHPPRSPVPLQMCTCTQTHRGELGGSVLWFNLCVPLSFTPPHPGGSPPQLKGGECAFIGMEAEMAGRRGGGGEGDWVCCLEKKQIDQETGEGWVVLYFKGGADRQESRFRGGCEGSLAGWLVPLLGCVWRERLQLA